MPSGFVPVPLPRLMRRNSDKINLSLMSVRSFLSFLSAFALWHRLNRGMNQAHERLRAAGCCRTGLIPAPGQWRFLAAAE